ncbi:pyridoxamine 5'-phosphate oxidase family protein [Streptomyces sp. NA04227]|uniref:pyridoxamine 5'-phosphate oxidase family protein n=1 Tax=Streptomyces sp. NA04227 TaxID=2742136 RepID=UPI00159197DB|nr:pyridoxamine 5'-phosphate oxidase family protein [Streptomyces sp. NA04227]QKW08676.1 pyridoxamine 5'-phosphate oxidase family protein [Streptomyces sp. NA04227]
MTFNWAHFTEAEPPLAREVEERFGLAAHHVLATLRPDGSPRTHGLEVRFLNGELWLGMMPRSAKALDLRRDPRFSLQANPGPGTEMEHGDVRVSGRAVEVTDPEARAGYTNEVNPPDPGAFHLFRTELTEVVRTSIEEEKYLVLRIWRPGEGVRTVRRT